MKRQWIGTGPQGSDRLVRLNEQDSPDESNGREKRRRVAREEKAEGGRGGNSGSPASSGHPASALGDLGRELGLDEEPISMDQLQERRKKQQEERAEQQREDRTAWRRLGTPDSQDTHYWKWPTDPQEQMMMQFKQAKPGTLIGCRYLVPLTSLTPAEVQLAKINLTFVPPESRKKYLRKGQTLENYCLYEETEDGYLAVPRIYGFRVWGCQGAQDLRRGGRPIPDENRQFAGSYRADIPQEKACRKILQYLANPNLPESNGGFLNLSCGYGKTFCMVNIICHHGRRALVLTSTDAQMNEAKDSFSAFAPHLRVGMVKEGQTAALSDPGHDVVLASMQTLFSRKNELTCATFRDFGLAFIDEAHHVAADTFSWLLQNLLPCRGIVGLSATPRRKDGRTNALFQLVGPILFQALRPPTRDGVYLQFQLGQENRPVRFIPGKKDDRGNPVADVTLMLNDICQDRIRNAAIQLTLLDLLRMTPLRILQKFDLHGRLLADKLLPAEGDPSNRRRTMVLGPRVNQLKELCNLVLGSYRHLHWVCLHNRIFLGFATEREMVEVQSNHLDPIRCALERSPQVLTISLLISNSSFNPNLRELLIKMTARSDLILAIDRLGAESFNSPELDTLVLVGAQTDMEQSYGRVMRGRAVNPPTVIDFADHYSTFEFLAHSRTRDAKKMGFACHPLPLEKKEILAHLPPDYWKQLPPKGGRDPGKGKETVKMKAEEPACPVELVHLRPKPSTSPES